MSASIDDFMRDPRLIEVCELQRTGDEVLDIISLSENQHSDLLAWLLDPREGHGQGDQILRDLLAAASGAAASECGLDRRGATAKFFDSWPVSRILTTGFGSAFIARELGMAAKERVDLFVIDPQNKFILLIENKAGLQHTETQLVTYQEKYKELVAQNPHLRDYKPAYIALDRFLDSDIVADQASSKSWLYLSYDWLQASAQRAMMHLNRGNEAARLVVNYCNRQTSWQSPQTKRAEVLAAELHRDHGEAIKSLLEVSIGRLEKQWLSQKGPGHDLLFMLQNKSLVHLLKETQGMAFIKASIASSVPALDATKIESGRVWLNVFPPGWENYIADGYWPIYLNVNYFDVNKSKYRLRLIFDSWYAQDEKHAEEIRAKLISFNSEFGKHNDKQRRRVVLASDLTAKDLLSKMIETLDRLAELSKAK